MMDNANAIVATVQTASQQPAQGIIYEDPMYQQPTMYPGQPTMYPGQPTMYPGQPPMYPGQPTMMPIQPMPNQYMQPQQPLVPTQPVLQSIAQGPMAPNPSLPAPTAEATRV